MAYDAALAARLRADLAGRPGLEERRMFGGLCIMLDGNMLCGTYADTVMYRVGKDKAAEALALPRVRAMEMAGRAMGGFVTIDAADFADPALRGRLMAMALAFVGSLPRK